jgi:cytochrome c peroxidase
LSLALSGATELLAEKSESTLTTVEQLGKKLFFDSNLSTPKGQSCAGCHAPQTGFTGPDSATNAAGAVSEGAVHGRFGNRKPPSAAYAGYSPTLSFDEVDGVWSGGSFWDGRATGLSLGDPLVEQAMGPFLNALEMNNSDASEVVRKVAASDYAELFKLVWGRNSLANTANVMEAYTRIARSIAAYERSAEVNPFSSKYDYYLKKRAKLTKQELNGLNLFQGKAMCSACHISQPGPSNEPPLFTDYTFDNLGVPRNPLNPFYKAPKTVNPAGEAFVDTGLAGFLSSAGYPAEVVASEMGKQKVPTLRNIDKRPTPRFVKAYMHNGAFKSLEQVVHFYNTRDVASWPAAEVPATVNRTELGNLRLSAAEEADLVAFLKTLTDGYEIEK